MPARNGIGNWNQPTLSGRGGKTPKIKSKWDLYTKGISRVTLLVYSSGEITCLIWFSVNDNPETK